MNLRPQVEIFDSTSLRCKQQQFVHFITEPPDEIQWFGSDICQMSNGAAIAIIPARGGSKRIPGKNVRAFSGKPIIHYPIAACLESGIFDRIIVSTDSREIGKVALDGGAEWSHKRPDSLSGDDVSLLEVMSYEVSLLPPESASYVCFLLATSPFVCAEQIRNGYNEIRGGQWDYVIAATKFPAPVQRAFLRTAEGGTRMVFENMYYCHSNEIAPAYHDAGQFYWGTYGKWIEPTPGFFGDRTTLVEIPRLEAQDIDTEEDWGVAEKLYEFLRAKRACV